MLAVDKRRILKGENHFQYFCIHHFVTCNPTEVNETIWELRYCSMQVKVTEWTCQVKNP